VRFCSTACQKALAPFHQHSCSPSDEKIISKFSIKKAVAKLKECIFQQPPDLKNLSCVLYRIKKLLDDDYDEDNPYNMEDNGMESGDVGYTIHTYARVGGLGERAEFIYRTMWAAPGMTDLLLNETLTSPFLEHASSRPPSYEFCWYIINVLVRTATLDTSLPQSPFQTSASDGQNMLRNTPLGKVAANRIVELYLNPVVVYQCLDAFIPAVNVMNTLCQTNNQNVRLQWIEKGLIENTLRMNFHSLAGSSGITQPILSLILKEKDLYKILNYSRLSSILLTSTTYFDKEYEDLKKEKDSHHTLSILTKLIDFFLNRPKKFKKIYSLKTKKQKEKIEKEEEQKKRKN